MQKPYATVRHWMQSGAHTYSNFVMGTGKSSVKSMNLGLPSEIRIRLEFITLGTFLRHMTEIK
jgi:hypothetical protein